jgi:hypothetical protein
MFQGRKYEIFVKRLIFSVDVLHLFYAFRAEKAVLHISRVKTLPSPAPLLIIVLPSAIDATTSGYLDPNTAAETIKGVLSTGTLGGWGIWDASHDYLVGTQLWSTQTYWIIVGKCLYPAR